MPASVAEMKFATCLVAPAELGASSLTLTGETFHHLFRVRRLPVGSTLRLADGLGSARWGRVASVGSAEATVTLGETADPNEAILWLEIWVPPARPQRLTWMVEKATEIGVAAIRCLDSERASRALRAPRLDRLERVARAAVEQCHRSRVPRISGPHSWTEAVARLRDTQPIWVLDPDAAPRSLDPEDARRASILIGPEGGWSPGERDELSALGAVSVGLGPRVLRMETAAVVGAALALYPARR